MSIDYADGASTAPASAPIRLLKAAADVSRLRLLRLLARAELNVGELVEATGMGQSSVSRHLAVLREADILAERQDGPRAYSRLSDRLPPESEPLLRALRAFVAAPEFGYEDDLSGLERVLRSRSDRRTAAFDRLAGDWDAVRDELLGGALAAGEVCSLLLPAGGRWVDIGAGTGLLIPWLAALAGPDGEVVAVDAAGAMVESARERVAALGLDNARVEPADMSALPLPDDWADGAVFSLSLGHADDVLEALREAARVTRPGGTVAVADVIAHDHAEVVEALGDGFRGFEPAVLRSRMKQAGLVDIRDIAPSALHSPGPEPGSGSGQGLGPRPGQGQGPVARGGAIAAAGRGLPRLTPLRLAGRVPEPERSRGARFWR